MPNHKLLFDYKVKEDSPYEVHYFPGGWAFFSCMLSYVGPEERLYVGAFLTIKEDHNYDINEYSNCMDNDVPITAMLIPY